MGMGLRIVNAPRWRMQWSVGCIMTMRMQTCKRDTNSSVLHHYSGSCYDTHSSNTSYIHSILSQDSISLQCFMFFSCQCSCLLPANHKVHIYACMYVKAEADNWSCPCFYLLLQQRHRGTRIMAFNLTARFTIRLSFNSLNLIVSEI